jgi:hypothetical protein
MTTGHANDEDDIEARRGAALQRALDTPIPSELKQRLADEIEPHTMNAGIKHGEVMIAVQIAYPLIVDIDVEALHIESLAADPEPELEL